jgi:hypothetical protein
MTRLPLRLGRMHTTTPARCYATLQAISYPMQIDCNSLCGSTGMPKCPPPRHPINSPTDRKIWMVLKL